MVEAYSEGSQSNILGVIVFTMVVRLFFNAAGAYGAFTFNIYLVGISLAVYVVEAILALMSFYLAGLLVAVFFAYPHVFFIKEVREGIMTKERYQPGIEEQSCCCV